MPATYSDVLLVGGVPNQWIKLVSNGIAQTQGTSYVSDAVTTFPTSTQGGGVFSFATGPPADIYTVWTLSGSLSSTQPASGDTRWVATGNTNYVVAYTAGDSASLKAGTFKSSGPNTQLFPGQSGYVMGDFWLPPPLGGTNDDTANVLATLNAAIGNGGRVRGWSATWNVADLSWPRLGQFEGRSIWATNGIPNGTIFKGLAGHPIITLPDTGAAFEKPDALIQGVSFTGGTDQILTPNGGVSVSLRDLIFSGPSHAGIYWKGFVQEWFAENILFSGGQYGPYFNGEAGSGSPVLFEKNRFKNIYCVAQTVNGKFINLGAATNGADNEWDIRIINAQQDGAVVSGQARQWFYNTFQTERNGLAQNGLIVDDTGTGTTGTPNLTVAGTGFNNGDTLTIQGGGANGTDLVTTVLSGGGTVNLVLNANLGQSITSAEVTNRLYSDFKTAVAGGFAPADFTFNNPRSETNSTLTRYFMDLSQGSRFSFVGGANGGGRPVYRPSSDVMGVNTAGRLGFRGAALIANVLPTAAWIMADGILFSYLLAGAVTITAPASPPTGTVIRFVFTQDASGGRTVSWPAVFKTAWQPAQAANAVSSVGFIYDGTNFQQLQGASVDQSGNQRVSGLLTALAGAAVTGGISLDAATARSANLINGSNGWGFQIAGTTVFQFANAGGSGAFRFLPPNISGVAAEARNLNIATSTLAITGGYATQRTVAIDVQTINGAFTINDAATLAIVGAPVPGTATITRKYQLWLQGTDNMRVDSTTGIGNGAATNVQAPAIGTGSGPTNPLLVAAYLPIYTGSTLGYIPVMR